MAELLMQEESSTPATPSSGKWKLYPKASGYYLIDDNGLEIGPLAPAHGWTPVYDTWTYASASTITIPTDGTTTYQKDVKIRFKQGAGFKYYVGTTIAATLITVAVNTDYVVANAAITDISYSYVENPFGWPGWFAFAPTITGFSANPTSAAYRYKILGNTVYFVFVQGGAGTSNATTFTISLPVAAKTISNAQWFCNTAPVQDNGVLLTTPGLGIVPSAATVLTLYSRSDLQAWTAANGKYSSGIIIYEI